MKITIKFYIFKLILILNFSFSNSDFWKNFPKKVNFQSKSEKINITIKFLIFKLVLVPIFSLNWRLRFFGANLPPKGSFFQSVLTDKIDTTIEYFIFELVFVSNLALKNFEYLDQMYPTKIFILKNRKSEDHLFST